MSSRIAAAKHFGQAAVEFSETAHMSNESFCQHSVSYCSWPASVLNFYRRRHKGQEKSVACMLL